jgi:hypothetical protein
MRAPPPFSLLIPAVLGGGLGLMLASCDKDRPAPSRPPTVAASAAAERQLKLESYDPPIPKAPLIGEKLDTTVAHPQLAEASLVPPPVISAPPAAAEPPAPEPRAYAEDDPARGRYIESRQAGGYDPGDPRAEDAPPPAGFHLTVPICRRAESQDDPLGASAECQGMLRAARDQARLCAQAYEDGDDRVVLSPACRQAAMTRDGNR